MKQVWLIVNLWIVLWIQSEINGRTNGALLRPRRYKRLVGKFIHLIVTRPDLSFAYVVGTKFMWALRLDEWIVVIHIFKYHKKAP